MVLLPVQYLCIAALFICLIVYCVFIYLNNGKKALYIQLRELAYKLMLLAEKEFESDNGKQKFEWVINKIYEFLPEVIKLFVTREELEHYVQQLYFHAKDLLDDGESNGSV